MAITTDCPDCGCTKEKCDKYKRSGAVSCCPDCSHGEHVQRYGVSFIHEEIFSCSDGSLVYFDDYAALEQKIKELEAYNLDLRRLLNLSKPINPLVAMKVMKEEDATDKFRTKPEHLKAALEQKIKEQEDSQQLEMDYAEAMALVLSHEAKIIKLEKNNHYQQMVIDDLNRMLSEVKAENTLLRKRLEVFYDLWAWMRLTDKYNFCVDSDYEFEEIDSWFMELKEGDDELANS